jgi:hypothetical protein
MVEHPRHEIVSLFGRHGICMGGRMLGKLRFVTLLALALSLPASAYAAEAPHPTAAHTAKPKPKHVKKTHAKPTKGRSAATTNPNVRASHKKVVKHAKPAPKKKGGPSQSTSPTVGTKV